MPDPLEMARNCADAIDRYARFQESDPVQAHITRAGEQGMAAAKVAHALASVSIAGDLRRIADHFDPPPPRAEAREDGGEPNA
jgi:hypothetical protein